MTCIVGLEHRGAVYIGSDSCAGSPVYGYTAIDAPKVSHVGPFLIGTCGYLVDLQVVKMLPIPKRIQGKRQSNQDYLIQNLIIPLRETLRRHGRLHDDDGLRDTTSTTLVGYAGKLYQVCDHFSVSRKLRGFDIIGSGVYYALGALAILKGEPRARIRKALAVAAEYDEGVCAPFHILKGKR